MMKTAVSLKERARLCVLHAQRTRAFRNCRRTRVGSDLHNYWYRRYVEADMAINGRTWIPTPVCYVIVKAVNRFCMVQGLENFGDKLIHTIPYAIRFAYA